jgi:hypothetical protein
VAKMTAELRAAALAAMTPEQRANAERARARMGPPTAAGRSLTVLPGGLDWPAPPAEEAFSTIAGSIVRAVEPHTEADPAGLLLSLLTIYGAVVGGARSFHQGTWQTPNLFAVLVGQTGVGRKGTAYSVIREVFDAALPGWGSIIVPGLGSGEGLLTYLKQGEPRALVLETEFARLLAAMSREGSTLSQMLRNAWDGNDLGRYVASAAASGKVSEHHVSVLGHVTDDELRRRLTSDDQANGFGNRILWAAVKRTKLVPFTQPIAGYVSPFVGGLRMAVQYGLQAGTLRRTPEYETLWRTFYENQPPSIGLSGNMTARAEPQVARLALVYALLDQAPAIDVGHLEAAMALWTYCRASVLYVFGDSTGDRDADALWAEIRAGGAVYWTDAKKLTGIRHAADMERATALLTRLGRIRVRQIMKASGGRAQRVIEPA